MSNEVATARESAHMILSAQTRDTLRNFAQINKGIVFRPGQQIRTISEMSSIYAESDIQENIPIEFSIHDLNGWLSIISLFKEPSFELGERSMVIRENDSKSSVTYYYAGQGMVKTPPDRKLAMPDPCIKFTLTEEQLSTLMKAASVLQLPEMVIESDGVNIRIGAENKKERHGNNYFLDVAGDAAGNRCKVVISIASLKLLKGGYDITIGKGMGVFNHTTIAVRYWVAADQAVTKFNED